MNILVTGAAGFIGFSFLNKYLDTPNLKKKVIGIDNINNYYDIDLKKERIKILKKKNFFTFIKIDIKDFRKLNLIIKKYKIDIIIHLAAQAGVRLSINNPKTYFENNLNGFFNILEVSRINKIKHLMFASTSSVYGDQKKFPIDENFITDFPKSFYAATKKSNEIMAYSYSKIYNLPCTAIRFFSVYGPFGRPDMAYFKWTKKMINGQSLELFNNGNHYRDFTYIDDVVRFLSKLIKKKSKKFIPYQVFNIGNSNSVKITRVISILKKLLNIKSIKIKNKNFQKGDALKTYAKTSKIEKFIKEKNSTNLEDGLKAFVTWYKIFYKIRK